MTTVQEIFETMEYGPAPESDAEARQWLASHAGLFGHFIDGVQVLRPDPGQDALAREDVPGQVDEQVDLGRLDARRILRVVLHPNRVVIEELL